MENRTNEHTSHQQIRDDQIAIRKGARQTDQIDGFKKNSNPEEAAAKDPIGSMPLDAVNNGGDIKEEDDEDKDEWATT